MNGDNDSEYENYYSLDGAKELAFRINDYWEQRGFSAGAHIFSLGRGFRNGSHADDHEKWGVASKLVGGLPQAARSPECKRVA